MLALASTAAAAAGTTIEVEMLSDFERTVQERGTHAGNPASPLDLRVTPVQGSRPGVDDPTSTIRISVITNASAPLTSDADVSFFDYRQPFQHRWKNKFLHSTLKNVSRDTGEATFTINGTKVSVSVPRRGDGSRGLIIADPCFHGAAAGCSYGEKFQTFSRMTALLNLAAAESTLDHVDYWMILGDNFYDRDGHLAQAWFDQLTLQTKSRIFSTVAGNHDYWGLGSPVLGIDADQFGNGNLQFYAMDSVASANIKEQQLGNGGTENVPGAFLDLSVDPDAPSTKHKLAKLENFFTYSMIGNVAFLLYSGGYTYEDAKPHFVAGCAWLKEAKPDVAFIAGHWNDYELGALGCKSKMDVPDVYDEIKGFDGCSQLDAKMQLKYIMGHTHCNKVTATDPRGGPNSALGMMVAGQGMEGCGNFGVPILNTKGDRLEVLYYEIQSVEKGSKDSYEEVSTCWSKHGLSGCEGLADVWLNQSVVKIDW